MGNMAPTVLSRSTLPATQPAPQPRAGMVKYGTPVMGFMGAVSVLMSPVPICPTFSPTMRNCVLLVKISAQRSVSAPALVTTMGATVSL